MATYVRIRPELTHASWNTVTCMLSSPAMQGHRTSLASKHLEALLKTQNPRPQNRPRLGWLVHLQQTAPLSFRLVVTSATLDVNLFSRHFCTLHGSGKSNRPQPLLQVPAILPGCGDCGAHVPRAGVLGPVGGGFCRPCRCPISP